MSINNLFRIILFTIWVLLFVFVSFTYFLLLEIVFIFVFILIFLLILSFKILFSEPDLSPEKMATNFYDTEGNPYSYSRHGKIFLRKINDTYRLNYIELESRRDHVPDTFLSLMLYVFFFIFMGVLGCIIQSCRERRRERT